MTEKHYIFQAFKISKILFIRINDNTCIYNYLLNKSFADGHLKISNRLKFIITAAGSLRALGSR